MVCSMNQNMCTGDGEGGWMGVCVSAYVEDSVPLCVTAWEREGRGGGEGGVQHGSGLRTYLSHIFYLFS